MPMGAAWYEASAAHLVSMRLLMLWNERELRALFVALGAAR